MRAVVWLAVLTACGSDHPAGSDATTGDSSAPACDRAKPFGPATLVLATPALAFRLGADGKTGYYEDPNQDLYVVSRADLSTPWGTPMPLTRVNSMYEEAAPSITGDGLTLYFSSGRSSTGLYVYAATRASTTADFANPNALTGPINTVGAERFAPFVRQDGAAIYFAADPGTGLDLYRSMKASSFDTPVAISELDSSADDTSPTVTPDDLTIYFSSKRTDGGALGDYDIWTASRSSSGQPFGAPSRVAELATAQAELADFITADGCTIYFHSDRDNGTFEAYTASKP